MSISNFEDCDVADAVRGSFGGGSVLACFVLVPIDVDPISKIVFGRREYS